MVPRLRKQKNTTLLCLVITLLGLASITEGKKKLDDFVEQPFKSSEDEGLYEVELNISQSDGDIMKMYADYNEDDMSDLVAVNNDRDIITFYIWNDDDWVFSERTSMTINFQEGQVQNLAAADFNNDNLLDVFVVFAIKDQESEGSSQKLNYAIFFQKYQKGNRNFSNVADYIGEYELETQPVLVDVNGDMHMDILFYSDGRKVSENNGQSGSRWELTEKPFSDYSDPDCLSSNDAFTSPHSIGLNDFNGDCQSDLFISSTDGTDEWFEYWIFDSGKYCLSCKLPLDSQYVNNHGVVTFGDFDDDAVIDMAFPVFSDPPTVVISYNWHEVDRSEDNLCLNRKSFVIGLNGQKCTMGSSTTHSSSKGDIVTNTMSSGLSFAGGVDSPSMIRTGDFNLDGYPDGLTIMKDSEDKTRVYYLKNKSCTSSRCNNSDSDRRGLMLSYDSDISDINNYTNVIASSFFDLGNLGSVDVLINYTNDDNVQKIVGYYNNWYDDAFYLRAQGVNGDEDASEGYYGMTFKFVATDVDANDYMKNGIQLSQNGYTALQTPYIMFGVGSTNNYFTKFTAAAPINSSDYDHEWTPIIPKSQLIVYANGLDASDWTLETILNPTEHAFIIMVCSVSALAILGVVILYLHKREKDEDKQNLPFVFYNF